MIPNAQPEHVSYVNVWALKGKKENCETWGGCIWGDVLYNFHPIFLCIFQACNA